MMLRNLWKAMPVGALVVMTLLSACGKQTFSKADYTTSAIAGQYVYIKPKLDLVVFQDESDSMANALAQVKPQLNNFLLALDQNWEYRFVVMPLQSTQTISSKYVVASDCTGVPGATCLQSANASVFNALGGNLGWINMRNIGVGHTDLGFQNMQSNINHLKSSGFVRNDAQLAIMVISNGEDKSGGVAYYTRPDGAQTLTSIDYTSPTTIASFNTYKNYFSTVKDANANTSKGLTSFYAVVAGQSYSNCYGGGLAIMGKRYMDMAGVIGTGSAAYDLCQGQLPLVLNNIRSQLITVVQTVVFNYVVLPEEPNPATIVLKKNGAVVPNSAVNGWTYAGYLANQPTSYFPTSGNEKSGFMIRLNGSAEFKGTDTISIDYQKK